MRVLFLTLMMSVLNLGVFGAMESSEEKSQTSSLEEPPQKKRRKDKRNILVISMDYDGCLSFPPFSLEQVLVPCPDVKLPQYDRLLAPLGLQVYLDQKIIEGGYTEIILCVGSNRQSEKINRNCQLRNKNKDCYACMEELCRRLMDHMKIPVSFHRMLTADLHKNLASGTHMEKRHKSSSMTVFDEHKLILHTMFIHSVYKEFALSAEDQLEYAIFDDRQDLLDRIQRFYKIHTDLIPKKCVVTTVGMLGPYVGLIRNIKEKNLSKWEGEAIKGTGKTFDPKKVWLNLVFEAGVVCTTLNFKKKFYYCEEIKRQRENSFLLLKTQLKKAIEHAYSDKTSLQEYLRLPVTSGLSLQEIEEDKEELEVSLRSFLSDSSIDISFANFMKDLQKQ